jgi:hypothetical protein
LTDQAIWEVFEAERAQLVPYAGLFDGFHTVPASVSKTCLVRFDNNKYSVAARAVGRPVEVHAYADCIVIRQDGRIVGEHRRSFGRGETIYDPWHYVPVLARKPGALRNGAPFKDGVLPAAIEHVRRKLAGADDGNRQMVNILTAVLTDGLPAVEAAPKLSPRAYTPPTSSSTFWRGGAIQSQPSGFSPRTPCGCSMSLPQTAFATTACGGPVDGTHRDSRSHG